MWCCEFVCVYVVLMIEDDLYVLFGVVCGVSVDEVKWVY